MVETYDRMDLAALRSLLVICKKKSFCFMFMHMTTGIMGV